MARFGLTHDSDEEEVHQDEQLPPKQPAPDEETGKGKGKARVVSPAMELDELVNSQRRPPRRVPSNVLLEEVADDGSLGQDSRFRDHPESSDEDEEEEEEEVEPERGERVGAPPPWPSRIGMEPHKIHVMQASLFRAPEEEVAMKAAFQRAATAGKTKLQQHTERLLNASAKLARKHSRGSEVGGDGGMVVDKAERASFDEALDPVPYRPTRKFLRVNSAQSVSSGQEGLFVDAGLAFGRSFRVSWGPGGQLARISGSSSSVVTVESIPMVRDDESTERTRSSRLLQVLLQHSTIELDESSLPFAFPSRSLSFSTFASLFPQHDNCHEAQVWRQGVALFDPLERQVSTPFIPPAIKHRLTAVQRRIALSEWLASTVASTVAALLRTESSSSAQRAFIRLTGYRVEEAVKDATADGNVHLAMLLSQAGSDAEFRSDLEDQLEIWAKEGVDQFVDEAYRKCLAVLAGVTNIWKSPQRTTKGDVNVVKGLDWKRAFGLALWYGVGSEGGDGYEPALDQFERTIGQNGAPMPLPWYLEDSASANDSSSTATEPADPVEVDALLELLRLASAKTPLERAIYPRAFGPCRLDYRMSWHLYILLSRAMRLKDFSDRENTLNDTFEGVEGQSKTADGVTCAYAAQLESLGQIQEAAFVLLHLEGSDARKTAVKDLLMRQAHTLEGWQIFGLSSLRIPIEWIEEAQACLSQYQGNAFDAYEHFLKADEQRMAHDIAVNDLAPDTIVRGDLSLLRALFKPFDPQAVAEWSFRGKLFIDYADATERIPELVVASQEDAVLDATEADELERYKTLVPQLMQLLPDIFRDRSDARQNAALSEMLSGLLLRFDSIKTKSGTQPQVQSGLVDEATRLRHIHSTAYDRFIHSVSVVA